MDWIIEIIDWIIKIGFFVHPYMRACVCVCIPSKYITMSSTLEFNF